jgi:DUF1680 family protein
MRLRSIPLSQIQVIDPFWSRYQRALVELGLPAQFRQIVETGRLRNFERAAAGERGNFDGYRFNDSDVYKWIEACAYVLAKYPSESLRKDVFHAIDLIAQAQMPDGYLNTYFQLMHPDMRWRNLIAMHEMYCAGHLIEAGVAVLECMGDRKLLEVGIKFADHIASIFGPGKRRGACGHQEIELALIKLSDATGDPKYRELARWMIEDRGQRPSYFEKEFEDTESIALCPAAAELLLNKGEYSGEYLQDHLPIREHSDVVGHAVRAMYFYIAAAQLEPDHELREALSRTWKSVTERRMYITGGIGPSGDNEGFTTDYDLPNINAYAETCAAVGLAFWGSALLNLTGNSEYADVMERAIYNGALAGISLDTTHYFYANPLESRGGHARVPWFGCACCPPNIARLIGSIGSYAVSQSDDSLWIHIPFGMKLDLNFNGVPVQVTLDSGYPFNGKVELRVEPESPVEFEICFRIPDWADDVETEIPGLEAEAEYSDGYICARKLWKPGDVAKFEIEMLPRWNSADPRVRDNLGHSALTFGPLVYAAEETDLGFAPQLFSANLDAEPEIVQSTKLEGISMIHVPGDRILESFPDQLYAETPALEFEEAVATFIPYYAWCNRGSTSMQVWIRT